MQSANNSEETEKTYEGRFRPGDRVTTWIPQPIKGGYYLGGTVVRIKENEQMDTPTMGSIVQVCFVIFDDGSSGHRRCLHLMPEKRFTDNS